MLRTANVMAALWPQRCSGLVAVSGYIVVNLASNLQPLAPQAEHGWHQHRVLDGIGHNVPQEAPEAFAAAVVDVHAQRGSHR